MLTRLTGTIRSVESKTGTKNGRDWEMTVYRVNFADLDFVEVIGKRGDSFRAGDTVDWVIKTTVNSGYLGVSRDSDYVGPILVADTVKGPQLAQKSA